MGAIPGLSVRVGAGGTANWSLLLRVAGEGGAKPSGRLLLGRKHRVNLGRYPEVSISAVRAKAAHLLDLAKQGVHPRENLSPAPSAAGLTVEGLAREFLKHHVHSRELDSARNYELAFSTHINPRIGRQLAERLTREHVREVMEGARFKRKRETGKRGGPIGGVEAARTTMGVLRHMYAWAIDEGKLKRHDNPASKIDKNLTGDKFPKQFTSRDLRRTVATRLAETLGDEGDKLVKRVLGHSDGSVTAIYNRYGYVREMRRALEQWAKDLTSTAVPEPS
jgi:integrase